MRARALAEAERTGTLSTHSAQHANYPFGSLVSYALDSWGRPVFLLSKLAMHTQNLAGNWRASLFIAASGADANPLAGSRVTLLGTVEQIPPEFGSAIYLPKHEEARQWAGFGDFSFYQLQVTAVYFIAGFGQMGWVPVDEYRAAQLLMGA